MYYNKNYPIKEIAILTTNRSSDKPNERRAKRGDIIVIRDSHFVIGTGETNEYMWLRVEGLEEDDCWLLREPNYDADYRNDEGVKHFDKRRHCIPLHRLKEVFPSLDINRAEDVNDSYQPFMIIDEDNGKYLTPVKPLSVHGLVFDKVMGEYL